MTDFRNMTVRTIARAEEAAKMNINILSSPNVYHSITLPSKKGNSGTNFGSPGGDLSQATRWTFHGAGPPYRFKLVRLRGVISLVLETYALHWAATINFELTEN